MDELATLGLVNELLAIKKEKELYKFAVQLKPDVAVDVIYLLPKKKVKYACFVVYALCDYYAKINKEAPLLYLVTLLADRAKRDKKFTKAINATLAFATQDPKKTRKLDTSDFDTEETPEEKPKAPEPPPAPEQDIKETK